MRRKSEEGVKASEGPFLPFPLNKEKDPAKIRKDDEAPTIATAALQAATFMSLIGWSLAWIVDKSCAFVVIIGRDEVSGRAVDSISKGTQEGQYRPGDTCRPWRRYQNEGVLELDSNMIVTRVSAALSIVLGAIVIGGLIVAYLKEWRRVRRMELSKAEGETSSNQEEVPSAVVEDSPPTTATSNNTPQKPNM